MEDYSFIRLKRSFNEAKDLGTSNATKISYNDQIIVKPNSFYSFITNLDGGIAFNGNYQVLLVDCQDNEKKDITDNVFISEFLHPETGEPQMKWEVLNIGEDFYFENVFFKFIHTVNSDNIFWSNPVLVTDKVEQTIRLDFKNYENLRGTPYEEAQIFQSIDLQIIYDKPQIEIGKGDYTTLTGNKVSSRVIYTDFMEFIMDKMDAFIYKRLVFALTHDIIYINGIRVTDKNTFPNTERFGDTNVSKNVFKLAVDYNETRIPVFQIIQRLSLINANPVNGSSILAIDLVGLEYDFFFNKHIGITSGFIAKLHLNGLLIDTLTASQVTVLNNKITMPFITSTQIEAEIENGVYSVTINEGTVYNIDLPSLDIFAGLALNEYKFTVTPDDVLRDYNKSDYNNSDYETSL